MIEPLRPYNPMGMSRNPPCNPQLQASNPFHQIQPSIVLTVSTLCQWLRCNCCQQQHSSLGFDASSLHIWQPIFIVRHYSVHAVIFAPTSNQIEHQQGGGNGEGGAHLHSCTRKATSSAAAPSPWHTAKMLSSSATIVMHFPCSVSLAYMMNCRF